MSVASLKPLSRRARVIYQRNPLVEVLAAVQFPAVLRLYQDAPKELQVKLGHEYPLTSHIEASSQVVVAGASGEVTPPQAPQALRTTTFSSVNRNWTITVAPTVLALTCTKYTEWSDFRHRFAELVQTFHEIYKVPISTRIGVRFRDVINKTELGVPNSPWRDLIRPEVLATFEFFTEGLDSDPAVSAAIQLAIPPGKVNISFAMVANIEKQVGFLIDTDCYSEDTREFAETSIMKSADDLHEYTSIVFQSCITDFLHGRLEPKSPPLGTTL